MALFGGDRPDHPMADMREAKKLVAELPANDSVKALEELGFWLDSIDRTDGFTIEGRFELADLIDQTAKLHTRKASQEYLAGQRVQKFQENKLWTAAFEFWKLLGRSYIRCVEEYQAGASGANAIRKQLPVIIARALRALTLQLKWALLRYGPVDDRIWFDIGRLYHFTETQRDGMAPVQVYPGAHGQSSVRQEFLKAMMLSVSSTDGLNPLQQEIAERTVAHFGRSYVIQERPSAGCTFYFDLSMRKPPARVLKDAPLSGHVRYFGAGGGQEDLAALMAEIRKKDGVPADVNLGGNFEATLVLQVLRHLGCYWSDAAPARRHERRKLTTRLTVAHGFNGLLSGVAPAGGEALDFDLLEGHESWIVENASEGGYGAIIPQVKGDWVRVGALVGFQTETSRYWGAGIIRRITRDEYQQRRVGIQILSHSVIPVTMSVAGTTSSIMAARMGEPAVLLSTRPDRRGEVALLLRLGTFTTGQSREMLVRDKNYLLLPSRLVEGGDDFDCAKFKVVQRD